MYYVAANVCQQVYSVESERILTVILITKKNNRKNKREERKRGRRRERKGREERRKREKTVMWIHNKLLRIITTRPIIPDLNWILPYRLPG